jgi:hypothetical protein
MRNTVFISLLSSFISIIPYQDQYKYVFKVTQEAKNQIKAASFYIFAAVHMRISLFCDMTLRPIAQERNHRIEDSEMRSRNRQTYSKTCMGIKCCLQIFRMHTHII